MRRARNSPSGGAGDPRSRRPPILIAALAGTQTEGPGRGLRLPSVGWARLIGAAPGHLPEVRPAKPAPALPQRVAGVELKPRGHRGMQVVRGDEFGVGAVVEEASHGLRAAIERHVEPLKLLRRRQAGLGCRVHPPADRLPRPRAVAQLVLVERRRRAELRERREGPHLPLRLPAGRHIGPSRPDECLPVRPHCPFSAARATRRARFEPVFRIESAGGLVVARTSVSTVPSPEVGDESPPTPPRPWPLSTRRGPRSRRVRGVGGLGRVAWVRAKPLAA